MKLVRLTHEQAERASSRLRLDADRLESAYSATPDLLAGSEAEKSIRVMREVADAIENAEEVELR